MFTNMMNRLHVPNLWRKKNPTHKLNMYLRFLFFSPTYNAHRTSDHNLYASIELEQLREPVDLFVLQSQFVQHAQENLLPSVYTLSATHIV